MFMILSTSCNSNRYFAFDEVRIVKSFPITYTLSSPDSFDLNIIGLQGIKIHDDYIFVSSSSDEGCLSVYSKDSMSHMIDILKIGNGPGEILYAPYVSWINFSDAGRCALIYDFKGNYLKYDLVASIKDKNPVWNFVAKDLPIMDAARYFYIDEEQLLCRKCKPNRDGYERLIVNSNGDEISTPNMDNLNRISSSEMNLLSTSFVINRNNNRIAEFGSRINVIHLYSYVDEYAITLSVGERMHKLNDYEQLADEDMRKMYYDSKSFDNCFAALYLDTTINELDSGTFPTPSIQLFDWEGNPIAEIIVPVKALFFDIDITEKKLYVIEYESEQILRYDISEICDML